MIFLKLLGFVATISAAVVLPVLASKREVGISQKDSSASNREDRGLMRLNSNFKHCAILDEDETSNSFKLYLCPSKNNDSKPEFIYYVVKDGEGQKPSSRKVEYVFSKSSEEVNGYVYKLKLEGKDEEIPLLQKEEKWLELSGEKEKILRPEENCSIEKEGAPPQMTYKLSCDRPWSVKVVRGLIVKGYFDSEN